MWETGAPFNFISLVDDRRFELREHFARAGVRGALALPAIAGEEVLAVIALCSREEAEGTERLMRTLTSLGHEFGAFLSRRRGELRPRALTPREREILQHAADGQSRAAIAAELGLSLATVKAHFEHIYAKLRVSDRASAVASALRDGVID